MKTSKQKIWIIVDRRGNPSCSDFGYTKKGCIKNFLGISKHTWEECKSWGWECVKATLIIQPR